MNVKFINFNGIKEYARVMYNDVKEADKYQIDVAYNGKDIKKLLEYLFELESKIDKAIEYIEKYLEEHIIEDQPDEQSIFYDEKGRYIPNAKEQLLDILKVDK